MKILSLYFKNINSLEGETRIDFGQNPLATAGVFAIVGPNGSGKSSILDAISLAFYGETFRFDRPSEHVMTAHTTESFAQVEFALGTQKYRTRWQVKRKDNQIQAELLSPQMQLTALDGANETVLAQDGEVSSKISEIIGMDFHSFGRSIMLAQGDFAAFLSAIETERMAILEKMYGSDIYEDHKQALHNNVSTAQTIVTQTKQELAALPLMDAIALEASTHDLIDFKEQISDYQYQQQQLNEQLAWVKKVDSLETQVRKLLQNQQQTSRQIQQKQHTLESLATLQPAVAFKNDIDQISELQKLLAQSNKTSNAYKLELNQLKNKLANLEVQADVELGTKTAAEQKRTIDELRLQLNQLKAELNAETGLQVALNKQQTEKQAIQVSTLRWLENHSAGKSLLEHFPQTAKLRELRDEIIEIDAQHQLSSRKFKACELALKKNTAALAQAKTNHVDYVAQLQQAENELSLILADHKVDELEALLADQQQRVVDFDELYAIARINQKLSSTGFFSLFTRKRNTEQTDLAQLKHQADDLAEQIAQAKNIQKALEQAVINEVLIQRLRHERPHLVDGKPCPLCGALQHPYAKLLPKQVNSKQALTEQKVRLHDLTTQADTLARQMAVLEQQTQSEVDKNQNLQKIRAEFITLSNKLNMGGRDVGIDNVSRLKEELKQEQAELSSIANLLARYQQQQDKITKLKLHSEKELETIKQLETVAIDLNSESSGLPQQLLELEDKLAKYRAEEKILAEQVLGQLSSLGETLPDKGKEDALVDRLTNRRHEYQLYVLRDKALTEELTPLMEKVAANQQKIDFHQEKVKQLEQSLQIEEFTGLHLAMVEKQKLLQEQELLYQNQTQQLQILQQNLQAKLAGSSFTTAHQILEALTSLANQPRLEQEIRSLQQQLEKIGLDLQKTQELIAAEQAHPLSTASETELIALQRSLKEKLAIANDEVRHIETKHSQQAGLQEKQSVLKEQLAEQEHQLAQVRATLQLSEDNGMAFRRQVQLKMISELLTQTNKMLEKISGRYYLRQVPAEQGLALEIEDTLQQNIRRLPKSLSGGESFVMSLALALGLSELANNGKTVDSLFLDEGFGNLDADALYMVMSTLQNLQTHGKTVGVISHVEAVKKRIKTRIEMVKKPNGLSQLKKVS